MVRIHLLALLIGGIVSPGAEIQAGWRGRDAGSWPLAGEETVAEARAEADSLGVAVLVHEPGVPDSLTQSEVRRVFLLRQRFWPDGSPVAPVNLPASSPIRETFSNLILGQSTRDLAEYWKDLYFHGTQPPPVLDSEQAVLLYVSRTRGGIGYVSSAFLDRVSLPPDVRVAGTWNSGG